MKHLSTSDLNFPWAELLMAVQREPVILQKASEDVAVILSMKDFENYQRGHIEAFQKFCDDVGARASSKGMTEKKLNDLLAH